MLSTLVELAAYAAFVAGGWMVRPWVGLVVLGIALWWIAQSLDGVKVRVPRPRMPRVVMPRLNPPTVRARRPGAHEA